MRPAADAPAPAPDARGVAVEPTEAEIAAAWDASAGPRPMRTPDHWRATSFREFGRSFARNIARALAARAERAEGRCEHAERAFAAEYEAREEDRAKYEVWRRNDIDVWRAEIERERQRAERAEAALREVMPVVELMGAAYIARYHHGEDSDEYVEALNEALSLSIGLVQYAREDTAARPPAAPQAGGDDA